MNTVMRTDNPNRSRTSRVWAQRLLPALVAGLAVQAMAGGAQLESVLAPSQGPPPGGSGDSGASILSPDGRYVLFASTANNLLLTSSNTPLPVLFPARLNVFLRDRTNGATTLVSVNLSGMGGGNGDSLPVDLSTNGRYALFESSANDLVAQDTNNATDVFVRDVVQGTTLLVSVSTNDAVGNGASRSAAMTPDGRYVAFVSATDNLVPGDTNGIADVFVRDLQTGTTVLASAGALINRASAVGSSSEAPDITPDGRYVAFYSTATNLVPGVTTSPDIYVHDLVAGTTVWASSYARIAVPSNSVATFNHALSADGRFIAYEACSTYTSYFTTIPSFGTILRYSLDSGQTDVVETNAAVATALYEDIRSLEITPDGRFIAFIANTNGTSGTTTCVLLWDAQSGTSTLVSGDLSGAVPANSTCDWPTVDATGRYVAFLSSAANLVTNPLAGAYHAYLRDVQAGTTTLLDADTNGVGSPLSPATIPRISAEAGCAVFACPDSNLVPNDSNRDADVFVRDLATSGCELISAHEPGLASLSPDGPSCLSPGSLSADGHYVAFASDADNLVTGDTNGYGDVFVHDRASGANVLVSAATNASSADGYSTEPGISADGRYVVFTSGADNLAAGDTNEAQDVFLRDLQTETTTLLSVNSSGTGPGNRDSYSPSLSADARYVLFRSKATNLTAGSFTDSENLFLRDRQASVTYALTLGGCSQAAMTPNGRSVAFVGKVEGLYQTTNLYLWDTQSASRVGTNTVDTSAAFLQLALSPDGQWSAYTGTVNNGMAGRLYAADLIRGTNWTIDATSYTSYPGLRFSRDGLLLAYAKRSIVSGTFLCQVRLYDFHSGTDLLLSQNTASLGAPAGAANWLDFSPDSRFVAYRAPVTNAVAGTTDVLTGIFLYDRQTGVNQLLTASRLGNSAADSWASAPLFSADGRTLFCQSWAADLAPGAYDRNGNLFAFTLLYISVSLGAGPGQGPWISWPFVPNTTYQVQFKDNLDEAGWQPVNGTVTVLGNTARLEDLASATGQRFYRVVAY